MNRTLQSFPNRASNPRQDALGTQPANTPVSDPATHNKTSKYYRKLKSTVKHRRIPKFTTAPLAAALALCLFGGSAWGATIFDVGDTEVTPSSRTVIDTDGKAPLRVNYDSGQGRIGQLIFSLAFEAPNGGAIYQTARSSGNAIWSISGTGLMLFSNNKATQSGGAFYFAETSATAPAVLDLSSLRTLIFTGNDAIENNGGAIYFSSNQDASLKIGNFTPPPATPPQNPPPINTATFSNNSAGVNGTGDGGAIMLLANNHNALLDLGTNVSFQGNRGDRGSAIYMRGKTVELTIRGNTFFRGNNSDNGSTIYLNGGSGSTLTFDASAGVIAFANNTSNNGTNTETSFTAVSPLTLNFIGDHNIYLDNGFSASASSLLTKSGSGTLVLRGQNHLYAKGDALYSADINGGTLRLAYGALLDTDTDHLDDTAVFHLAKGAALVGQGSIVSHSGMLVEGTLSPDQAILSAPDWNSSTNTFGSPDMGLSVDLIGGTLTLNSGNKDTVFNNATFVIDLGRFPDAINVNGNAVFTGENSVDVKLNLGTYTSGQRLVFLTADSITATSDTLKLLQPIDINGTIQEYSLKARGDTLTMDLDWAGSGGTNLALVITGEMRNLNMRWTDEKARHEWGTPQGGVREPHWYNFETTETENRYKDGDRVFFGDDPFVGTGGNPPIADAGQVDINPQSQRQVRPGSVTFDSTQSGYSYEITGVIANYNNPTTPETEATTVYHKSQASVTLNGQNSFLGGVVVSQGGTLVIANNASYGTWVGQTADPTAAKRAGQITIDADAGMTRAATLTVIDNPANPLVIRNRIVLTEDSDLNLQLKGQLLTINNVNNELTSGDAANGGAIRIDNATLSMVELASTPTTFDHSALSVTNSRAQNGGAIAANYTGTTGNLILGTNVYFGGNAARSEGGALYLKNTHLQLNGGTALQNNTAVGNGGALYMDGGKLTLNAGNDANGWIVFSGNRANGINNAAYFTGNVTIDVYDDYTTKPANPGRGVVFDDPITSGGSGVRNLNVGVSSKFSGTLSFFRNNELNPASTAGGLVTIGSGFFRLNQEHPTSQPMVDSVFRVGGMGSRFVMNKPAADWYAPTLVGGGTIIADSFAIAGSIAPDTWRYSVPSRNAANNTMIAEPPAVQSSYQIGTLKLQGKAVLGNTTLNFDLARDGQNGDVVRADHLVVDNGLDDGADIAFSGKVTVDLRTFAVGTFDLLIGEGVEIGTQHELNAQLTTNFENTVTLNTRPLPSGSHLREQSATLRLMKAGTDVLPGDSVSEAYNQKGTYALQVITTSSQNEIALWRPEINFNWNSLDANWYLPEISGATPRNFLSRDFLVLEHNPSGTVEQLIIPDAGGVGGTAQVSGLVVESGSYVITGDSSATPNLNVSSNWARESSTGIVEDTETELPEVMLRGGDRREFLLGQLVVMDGAQLQLDTVTNMRNGVVLEGGTLILGNSQAIDSWTFNAQNQLMEGQVLVRGGDQVESTLRFAQTMTIQNHILIGDITGTDPDTNQTAKEERIPGNLHLIVAPGQTVTFNELVISPGITNTQLENGAAINIAESGTNRLKISNGGGTGVGTLVFSSNIADYGGAIGSYMTAEKQDIGLTVGNDVVLSFVNNRAYNEGGAIYLQNEKVAASLGAYGNIALNLPNKTIFEGNYTSDSGVNPGACLGNGCSDGGGSGGAVFLMSDEGSVLMQLGNDAKLSKNHAYGVNDDDAQRDTGGGAIYAASAGRDRVSNTPYNTTITLGSNALVSENTVNSNDTTDTIKSLGGAIYAASAVGNVNMTIGSRSLFSNNAAIATGATEAYGGAIAIEAKNRGNLTIGGGTYFIDNSATTNGGAIWFSGDLDDPDGGSVIALDSTDGIIGFSDNTANGKANSIAFDSGATTLAMTGKRNIYFNDPFSGSGSGNIVSINFNALDNFVQLAGDNTLASSGGTGTVNLTQGTLRIVDGATLSVTDQSELYVNATTANTRIAGGGTITATRFTFKETSALSPDSLFFEMPTTASDAEVINLTGPNRIGELYLNGKVEIYSTKFEIDLTEDDTNTTITIDGDVKKVLVSDLVRTGQIVQMQAAQGGSNSKLAIDMQSWALGTYKIIDATAGADSLILTENDITLNGRQSGADGSRRWQATLWLDKDENDIYLTTRQTDNARLIWRDIDGPGNGGKGLWDHESNDWNGKADLEHGLHAQLNDNFLIGDWVVFDARGAAAYPPDGPHPDSITDGFESGNVKIAAGGVIVSRMDITGGKYVFTGETPSALITGQNWWKQNDDKVEDQSGDLRISGNYTEVTMQLATAFVGGIQLGGGLLEVDHNQALGVWDSSSATQDTKLGRVLVQDLDLTDANDGNGQATLGIYRDHSLSNRIVVGDEGNPLQDERQGALTIDIDPQVTLTLGNIKTATGQAVLQIGGAIHVAAMPKNQQAPLTVRRDSGHLVIADSVAEIGGGVGISSAGEHLVDLTGLASLTVDKNSALFYGGGIGAESMDKDVRVTLGGQISFTRNQAGTDASSAGGSGGAVSLSNIGKTGGGANLIIGSFSTVAGNTAANHSGQGLQQAGYGGAFNLVAESGNSNLALADRAFVHSNEAGYQGGAAYVGSAAGGSASVTLQGNTFFTNNKAEDKGGALFVTNDALSQGSSATGSISLNTSNGIIAFAGNVQNSSSAASENAIHLEAGVNLNVAGGHNVYFDDPISSAKGGNTLTINQGGGMVQFVGNSRLDTSNVSGNGIDVQSGTLRVAVFNGTGAVLDASGDGIVHVANGAALAGGGSVGAAGFLLNGIISPDNAYFQVPTYDTQQHVFAEPVMVINPQDELGNLTLGGDVELGPTAVYKVELRGKSADHITINGDLKIDPQAVVHVDTDPAFSTEDPTGEWTIISLDGDIVGRDRFKGAEHTSVGSLTPFLDLSLLYELDAVGRDYVKLVVSRNKNEVEDMGDTPNQIETGKGVESDPDSPIYNEIISNDDEDEIKKILDELSGEIHATAHTMILNNFSMFMSQVQKHLHTYVEIDRSIHLAQNSISNSQLTASDVPMALAHEHPRMGAWASVEGTHSRGRATRDHNAAFSRLQGGALTVGFDGNISESHKLGGALRFGSYELRVDERHSEADLDSYAIALYGGKEFENDLHLVYGGVFGINKMKTTRNITLLHEPQTLKADYDTKVGQVFAELGYLLNAHSDRVSMLEPYIGLAWNYLKQDKFTEASGSAALHSPGVTDTNVTLAVGGRVQWLAGRAIIEADASWRHLIGSNESKSKVAFAGGDYFTIKGTEQNRNGVALEFGVNFPLWKDATLRVAYDGMLGTRVETHGGFIEFRQGF